MIIGVDVGGTNVDIVYYDGEFKHVATFHTKDVVNRLNEILEEISRKFKAKAVGIGFAGWIRNRKILKAPNIRHIKDINLSIQFKIENDANCFALYSSQKFGFRNLIGITIGTGIGSGIIVDGKIYRGTGLAGEIGHWFVGGDKACTCGGKGHLEAYFGGWSFEERGLSPKDLVESGKIYNLSEFETFCICIANAITLLDVECVAFGGRIGGSLEEEMLREKIYKYLMPEFRPEIKVLKDPLAVAKGACLAVME